MKTVTASWRVLMVLSFLGAMSGCTKEKTVFVERPIFTDPPEGAQGFLGYDEAGEKLTVCGNCHVGQQAQWAQTAHADAWATLQSSGHAQAACENCHTVGPNGNASTGNVGYAGAKDARYEDVQCESCHGPGLNHVNNPDASQPLASIKVGLDPATSTATACGECHQGTHSPFVEEWSQSKHGRVNPTVHARTLSAPADAAACLACHTGQGALKAWGVNANYVEKDAPASEHVGIVCAVCHDPHGSPNSHDLRYPINVPDPELNLCMRCHHRRATPEIDAASLRGPHSPEGPLLLGQAGWWPPGFEPQVDRIVGTHGTTGNPRLCASCHVASFTVRDADTGAFQFQATGHIFQAIPCLDENGLPTTDENCDLNRRYFEGCAVSGCHGSAIAARSAYVTAKQRIGDLVTETERLLTLVPTGELNLNDGRFTTADGVWFNAQLGKLPGSSTHNPFQMEQLLVASIHALCSEYGVGCNPAVSLDLIYN